MALLINANSETLDHGSGDSLDDVFEGWCRIWFMPNQLLSDSYVFQKTTSGAFGFGWQVIFDSAGQVELVCEATGAFGNTLFIRNSSNTLIAGEWHYVAFRWSDGGGDANQQMCIGTVSQEAVEPTYTTQSENDTALVSNAGNSLVFGRDNGFKQTDMHLALFEMGNVSVPLEQLIQAQFPLVSDLPGAVLRAVYDKASDIPDRTGWENNGTVSGATLSEQPPIDLMKVPRIFVPAAAVIMLTADPASYAWSGQAASLEKHHALDAAAASYAWGPQDASLEHNRALDAQAAAFAWSGQDATLTYLGGETLLVEPAAYAWTGGDTGFLFDRALQGEATSYGFSPASATLIDSAAPVAAPPKHDGLLRNVGRLMR